MSPEEHLERIHAAIPHRAPFLLVDEIVEQSPDRIVCRKRFTGDEYFFSGHYPNFPIVPGVLLCEAAMQAGAILLSTHMNAAEGGVPVATRLNDVRLKRMVRPGDALVALGDEPNDAEFGSYGLDQCLDLVEAALARGNGVAAPNGDDWLVGEGLAIAMHDTAPPTEHRSEARLSLEEDGHYLLATGTAEFGNGTTTQHAQIVASVLGTTTGRVKVIQSDTDRSGYDTGAFASTGTTIAANGARLAAEALRERVLEFASTHSGADRDACRLDDGAVRCNGSTIALSELAAAAGAAGHKLAVSRKAYGAPRSVAFNAQGFRVAVHRVTGELAILQSVHAADAGVVINPMQCRAQVEGAVAQGIGFALYELMAFDQEGAVVNPTLRNYRIPAFADTPRTEVRFADTHDAIGPLGAKGMGECPINPVAPALANAIADATGVRFRDPPFRPDRIYRRVFEEHGAV